MKELVLSVDCGTQSLKAFLFNNQGKILKEERVFYAPYFSKNPGWTEQDADLYWKSTGEAVRRIVTSFPEIAKRIRGITITTQRATLVVVDEKGNPLRPAIVWLDQRKAKFDAKIPFFKEIAYKFVGMSEASRIAQSEAKVNWIRQNEPGIFKKAFKFLFLSGYLNYKLTGKFIDSKASQVGYLPFDHKRRDWASPNDIKSIIFPVSREKLVELVEPSEKIGKLTKEASDFLGLPEGLAVFASASDKSCETLAMGVLSEDVASLSFGTTATIQVTTKKYFEPVKHMPAYVAAVPGHYNPEIEIFRGFWMITWFKEEFGAREVEKAIKKGVAPEELMNDFLKKVPAGSLGLMVQPYWTPGLKMPEAKGAMIGFGSVHTRAHIYKAIIEGLGYALRDGKEKIERMGDMEINKLAVSGGGAQSDEICQITSDIFNLPVYRGETHESSGLGAAIDAFVGLGSYNTFSEAVKNMVRYGRIFNPKLENVEIYEELFKKVYSHMYPHLKPLYGKIRDVIGYPEKP